MSAFHFYKYQGTGNDFVIMDNRNGEYDQLTEQQVNRLCDRRFGIGADGLMLLNKREGYDFAMKYYNADGRESSMCGNGGRCLVAFARKMGLNQEKLNFIAIDGPHEATLKGDDWVNLKMQDVDGVEMGSLYYYLNTGSPHFVKFVDNVQSMDVFNEGRQIRYNDRFAKEGTNVNFVQPTTEGIFVRTYERGVEDETYSCGTGVTAAALMSAGSEEKEYVVPVQTLGGALEVRFTKTGERSYKNIWLCGPATLVFEGNITLP
ncbi:diaminopimelate epimerase [Chitinophaga tropicalis]|uniref:Diaminopimelate epimerase n=1 Tax=Chitinophaga tropicalis TaxID=2683588 RepID=A0A7K1U389_9BACT|nr:diaminopimelate epimerase [Chitinophaga tropicalis]MVT08827.1 diaminopimelate epimerase [Chitinophaga tropicalis]